MTKRQYEAMMAIFVEAGRDIDNGVKIDAIALFARMMEAHDQNAPKHYGMTVETGVYSSRGGKV